MVDFYNQSNTPQIIFTTKDPDDDSTRNGKMVSYDTMGNIEDIVDMKMECIMEKNRVQLWRNYICHRIL